MGELITQRSNEIKLTELLSTGPNLLQILGSKIGKYFPPINLKDSRCARKHVTCLRIDDYVHTHTGLIITEALSVPDKSRTDKRTGLCAILWWGIKSHGGPSVIINPSHANFCFVFCCVNSRVLLLLTVPIKPSAFTASQRHWALRREGSFGCWFSGVFTWHDCLKLLLCHWK